jgi:putative acetyltransferase
MHFAVLPDHQNKGIGFKLVIEGNAYAFEKGFKKIFVLGDTEYYHRFGFELAKNYNYYSEFDPEGEHFMIMGKELKKEPEKTVVNYCGEFNG